MCSYSECIAEIAVTLPDSWEIGNCSFIPGNASEPQSCNITATSQNSLLDLIEVAPGYKRPALNSMINNAGEQVTTGRMSFTITPRSAGDFVIAYTGSGSAFVPFLNSREWMPGGTSENNRITIAPALLPAAVAVPTTGALSLGALSLLMLGLAIRAQGFMSKKSSRHTKSKR